MLPQNGRHPSPHLHVKPKEEGELKMFCSHCGIKCSEDANFCKQCGHKLEKSVPPKISEEDFALPASPEEAVSKLLLEAFRQFHAGEIEAAMQACQEALALDSNSTTAHSLMGMLYEKQGEREKAIAAYETVLRLNPGSIADREKLAQLRGITTRLTPRKIISVRRTPKPMLVDSPAGAAVIAVGITLLVLMVGGGYIWWRASAPLPEPKPTAAPVANKPASPPLASPMPQQNDTAASYSQNMTSMMAPPASNAAHTYNNSALRTTASPRNRTRADLSPMQPQPIRPAPISPPETPYLERDSRYSVQAHDEQNTTIHLPDSALPPSEATTTTNEQPLPPRRIGKIEIVVAPEETGAGKAAGLPAEVKSRGVRDGNSSTMDSRARRDLARRLQLQGQYRQALAEYTRALDGAGDDAGLIHQQIALCYQRLDDKESAISHYNEAIAAYKKQLNAGRNVEAAQRGIQAAEMGIRACK
jgi:tetratricopeptide (TPR) repeat protein